jgi:DNA-binding MarR family transcriptional regulator
VTDAEVLSALADADFPVLSTTDIGEELGIGQSGAFKRLDELEDRGYVESRKIGNARAWRITGNGRDYLASLDA